MLLVHPGWALRFLPLSFSIPEFKGAGKLGAEPSRARTIWKRKARVGGSSQLPHPHLHPPWGPPYPILLPTPLASCRSQGSSLCHTARQTCIFLQSDFFNPPEVKLLMPILPMTTAIPRWLWVSFGSEACSPGSHGSRPHLSSFPH